MADYFSKFPYVFPVVSTHHFKTISHLHELFAAEGMPAIIMSNNRPPFNGDEFRQFSHDFDFVHTTSSPHFHQSNGLIESMVKKVKNAYKMDRSPNAQAKALLQLHDTPIMADLPSPAEILHGPSSTGYRSFKTIQEGQYTSDLPETCQAARETERTVQQSPLSQRSTSPEGERMSPSSSKTNQPQAPSSGQQVLWLRYSNVDNPT